MTNAGWEYPKNNSKAADVIAIATKKAATIATVLQTTCIPSYRFGAATPRANGSTVGYFLRLQLAPYLLPEWSI